MISRLTIQRRRQVFGAVLIMVAVVLLVVAMVGRAKFVSYAALAVGAVGVWMLSRRKA